eukprot:1161493-Pelagomonas_calceolata.AAC.8
MSPFQNNPPNAGPRGQPNGGVKQMLLTSMSFYLVPFECLPLWTTHQMQVQEANQMVEEMMLLANVSVAEAIAHHFPSCSLLRRHPVGVARWACRYAFGGGACTHSAAQMLLWELDPMPLACGHIKLMCASQIPASLQLEQDNPSFRRRRACSAAIVAHLTGSSGSRPIRLHVPAPRQFEPILQAAAAVGLTLDVSTSKVRSNEPGLEKYASGMHRPDLAQFSSGYSLAWMHACAH